MRKRLRKNKIKTVRKVRTDKKVHVGPTLSIKLKREVERLAFILDIPVKKLGEALCYEGIHHEEVIKLLSYYFVEGQYLSFKNHLFRGSEEHKVLTHFEGEETDRISIRFTQRNYGDIILLARLLGGISPSRATAVMIDSAIRNVSIIELLFREYNRRKTLTDQMTNELKRFMKFVDKNNPYENTNWSARFTRLFKAKRTSSIMLDPSDYEWLPGNASPTVKKNRA